MRRIIFLISFLALVIPNVVHAGAEMGNYCSAPPYVTRTVIPNLLVLMDNSADMENPAYTDNYDPNKSIPYSGYFNPGACYTYANNRFEEGYKPSAPNAYTSYTSSDTCPSSAPFRGSLLNWATTSRYDILEDVLLGGNSVSKQSNVNTLLSISGDWTDTTNPATPAKIYNGCQFLVNNANLTVKDVTAGSCTLLNATPAPIAFWDNLLLRFANGFKRIYYALLHGTERAMTYVAGLWQGIAGTASSWAAPGSTSTPIAVSIYTGNLNGTTGVAYSITLQAYGKNASSSTTFTWSMTATPSWLTAGSSTTQKISGKYYGVRTWSGTPLAPGDYTLSGTVTDNATGDTQGSFTYTIHIVSAPLLITSPSSTATTLPAGTQNAPYVFNTSASGGFGPYNWTASNLPAGLGICNTADSNWNTVSSACVVGGNSYANGTIYGTPTATGTFSSINLTVTDSQGDTATKSGLSLTVSVGTTVRSQQYNVKIGVLDEPLNDLNGNNIWDLGETFTDLNGNGVWDGKQGLLQKYWDDIKPRARWGQMDFGKSGATTKVIAGTCVPASPLQSFLTGVQNATATPDSPLAQGLFGAINYYINGTAGNSNYDGNSYQGCSNADPIPNDLYQSCRKNFVLILTSGTNLGPASGYNFSATGCSVPNNNNTAPLVQNACYGYNNDLRSDREGKQLVQTYVVNTMGTNTTNNAILEDAAKAGGGKYYPATDASQLQQQIKDALTDILGSAASGTAVSVLTTSSRGSGSMIQSYFLPTRQEGTRQVSWTGYTQNLWIDPQDNLREDTENDYKLNLLNDHVLKLYFDNDTKQTMAATFTTLADGTGGTLGTCSSPAIKPFKDVTYLWEAGKKLAAMSPSSRNIFTSTKVIRTSGTSTISTATTAIGTKDFTVSNVTGTTALNNALNPDVTYSATNIVNYILGVDLETSNTAFRDRRITVDGSLQVWKLGDVISSTPKVFADTPLNTYHINYSDGTYYNFITSTNNTGNNTGINGYTGKSAVAFVGANDGMLHAFRVGYMKTGTGLLSNVIALFQNFFSDTATDRLGEEIWGFIPFNAFPYLKYLADPSYCHLYYNDLSVRLVDASIGGTANPNPGDNKTVDSWHTILIGGMRFGGASFGGTPAPPLNATDGTSLNTGFSAYYALDISDPENPTPLWEFSDDDMGYATTYPTVIRTGAKGLNGNWYVVIGSGSTKLPMNGTDINRASTGFLYILDLKTGALVKKINLQNPTDNDYAIVGDILSIDANTDFISEALYFGTSYTPDSGGSWYGKIMNLAIPSDVTGLCGTGVYRTYADCAPASNPPLRTLFKGSYPFTASPDAAKDVDGNLWVYAGSGKYYSDVDESDQSDQIFLGFKDKSDGTITYPLTRTGTVSPLDNRTGNSTTGTVVSTSSVCSYNSTAKSFGFQTFVSSITPTSPAVSDSLVGWFYDLTGPERVISRPLAVGGLVDFLSYVPSSAPCDYGGSSKLYALGYTTGVAPFNVAIHAPDATNGVTSGSVTVQPGVLLGPGAPPTGEAIIIPPPKPDQETLKKKIQVATGVIVEAENQPVISVMSKIMHWLKK